MGSRRAGLVRAGGVLAVAGLGWGLVEAQWLERRIVEVALRGLSPVLDGLRILHLSDLHVGGPSFNVRTLRKAIDWAGTQELDLAVITGDLLARPGGEPALRSALGRLRPRHGVVAVQGNVDVSLTRDPFSGGVELESLAPEATVLRDEVLDVTIRGRRVQLVGTAARSRTAPPAQLADPDADLRILLAHFPDSADRVPAGAFDLILAGHTHDGQICIPFPGGKRRLAGPFEPYPVGRYDLPAGVLVVSRGVGTTFVPVRFWARPEAAVLVLRTV